MMGDQNFVYWIRTSDMTDIKLQGYVGVTNNIPHREKQHISACKCNSTDYYVKDMYKALISGDYIIECVATGNSHDCYNLEYELRPNYNIGWNRKCGGKGVRTCEDRFTYSAYKRMKHISNKTGCIIKPSWENTQGFYEFESFYLQGIDGGRLEMVLPRQGLVDENTIRFLSREDMITELHQKIDFFNDGVLYSTKDLASLLNILKPNTLTTQLKRGWSFGKIFMKAWNNGKTRTNT